MADNNKTITIGAKVDPNVKTVFASLEKEIAKANKTLGAGTAANPGMAKNLKEQKDALLSIKKIGIDAFKTLAQEAERAASKEQTALGRMKKYVSELKAEYMGLSAAQKAASGVQTQGRGANFQPQITRWSAGQGAYGVPPLANGGGGGGWNWKPPTGQPPPSGGPSGKPSMSPSDVALIGAAVASAVGNVMQRGAQMGQAWKNTDVNMSGQMQQMTTNRFLQEALNGDARSAYVLNKLRSPKGGVGAQLRNTAGGQGMAQLGTAGAVVAATGDFVSGGMQMVPGVGGAAGAAAGRGFVRTGRGAAGAGSQMAGAIMSGADAVHNAANGGWDLTEMQSMTGNIDAHMANNPMLMAAFDMINQEKHMRASQSRRLQGQEGRAWGLGAGFGYGRSEAGGVAEGLQALGGMSGMWDTPSKRRAYATGSVSIGAPNVKTNSLQGIQAFNDATLQGSTGQLSVVGGEKATKQGFTGQRGLARSAMQLAAYGIDMGVGQGALSNILQAQGGGDKFKEGSMQVLERAIARGTAAGFTDPRTAQELVGALGQAAQGRIMDSTDALDRLANFMMGGSKTNGTVAEAQANNRSMAGLNNMSKNPYVNGKQLAFAKTISNDQIQQEYLGRATIEQLAAGPDARMQAVGVTKEMMKKTLQYTMQNLMSSVSGASPKLQAALKAGGPIDEKLLMAEGFGRMGAFDNDQDALSAARKYNASFSDLDIKTERKKGGLPNYTSGAAVAAISMEEKTKAILESFVREITKYMSSNDNLVKAIQQQKQDEIDMKSYDVKNGSQLVVRVISGGGMARPPTDKKLSFTDPPK